MKEVDYTTDPARQAQMLREFRRDTAPLMATATQLMIDAATRRPQLVGTAHLDTKRLPHMRALQRRLRESRIAGDVLQSWHFLVGMQAEEQLAKIDARWASPMRASVAIIFDMIRDRDMLQTVARTGTIQLVLDRMPGDRVVESIVLPVDQDDLRRMLAITEPLAQKGKNQDAHKAEAEADR